MIEESKDLTSLSLDELIRNLKVHEMIIKNVSQLVKAKGERKSLALNAKKESCDEESLTSRRNALDAKIPFILSEIVPNHRRKRTKEISSEVLRMIAMRKMMKRLRTTHVSWLKHPASETKETKFVKSQNETSTGCGPPIADGSPHNVPTPPKSNQGPPVCSSEKEKYVSLGPKPKHIMVNNVKIHVARDDEICIGIDLEPDEWIKDSGCSKHMTRNQKLFSTYKAYNEDEEEAIKVTEKKNLENDIEDETLKVDEIVNIKESKNHPLEKPPSHHHIATLTATTTTAATPSRHHHRLQPSPYRHTLPPSSSSATTAHLCSHPRSHPVNTATTSTKLHCHQSPSPAAVTTSGNRKPPPLHLIFFSLDGYMFL
nr:retrotransposon protein [Tanacetum cinerariifolium]